MPHWCNGEHKRVKFAGWRFNSVVWHPLLLLRAPGCESESAITIGTLASYSIQ